MMSSIRLTSGHPAQMLLQPLLPAEQQCPPCPPLWVCTFYTEQWGGITAQRSRLEDALWKRMKRGRWGGALRWEAAGVGAQQGVLGRCQPSPWKSSQSAPSTGDRRRSESSWTDLSTFILPPASSCDPRPEVRDQRWLIKPCRWQQLTEFTCLSRVSAPVFTSVISSAAAWQKQGGPQLMILYNHYSVNTVINQHK